MMTKARSRQAVVMAIGALALAMAACGRTNLRRTGDIEPDDGGLDTSVGDATDGAIDTAGIKGLLVSPDSAHVQRNDQLSFIAQAQLADGSVVDVTELVEWSSSDGGVAASMGGGVFFGLAPGKAVITAAYGAVSDSAQLTVDPSNVHVTLVNVEPVSPTMVGVPSTLQLHAWAAYSDGHKVEVTALASWSSTATSVATVAGGKVTSAGAGSTVVRATWRGVTGETTVSVTTQAVKAVAITPAAQTVAVGATATFKADVTLADGSHQDVSSSAIWSSSSPSVATVSAGVATALQTGKTTITALVGGVQGAATLTVSSAKLTSLQVDPVDPTVGVGVTLKFTATGSYSDGSTRDLTSQAGWTSSSPAVLSVDSVGIGQSLSAGTAVVMASYGGRTATSTVTVSPAALKSITVTPANSTLALKGSAQLNATGTYANGMKADLTSSVVWTASPVGVVVVSNALGSAGTVTALASGTATVTASFGAITGSASITVSPASLTKLVIQPAVTSVIDGMTVQLRAMGTYSDGNVLDVTSLAGWSSSNSAMATVSNSPGSQGTVTGVSAGVAIVTAKMGILSATASVTVTAAVLNKITVTPAYQSIPAGQSRQYSAAGTYSDGSTTDLTAQVSWSTGSAATATISNVSSSKGLLLARAAGVTSVTATLGTVSGSTSVTITGPVLTSVSISPAAVSSPVGTPVQFTAAATYSDGTTKNVTGSATWSSSAAAVATIDATGKATPVATGTTYISTTYMGQLGTASLTVTAAVPTKLQITPLAPTLAPGASQQFQAMASYSDGTTKNVTLQASWSSSNGAVLIVGSSGSGGGLAYAVATGTATLTAAFSGLQAATGVTVTQATLLMVSVTPSVATLPIGVQASYVAQAIYSNGSSVDVTGSATWSSSDASVAVVGNTGPSKGVVTAARPGQAQIRATYMGVQGAGALTVIEATLTKIQVTPFQPTSAVGSPVQFQAVAVYSDGSSMNVTSQALWSSSNTAVAAVSNATASRGLATTWSPGVTTISAQYMAGTGSSTLTVSNATVTAIQVTPFTPTIPVGFTQQMTATAIYSDGAVRDVTAQATWTSSSTGVAPISDALGSKGLVWTLAAGSATIKAQVAGFSGTTVVTVSNAQLAQITVTPGSASAAVNGLVQFTATGIFTDGNTRDISASVTWSSSNVAVADISNATDSRGQAKAFAPGVTTITAQRLTVKGTATLTVK